ncbi:MAG: hypothetical protein K9K86_03205 [Pseudomonadales bacterium]|nr:hypothetical protein [Pseudomonadales bacterium]
MNVWFSKNLGDALLAGTSLDHIRALFVSAYEKSLSPKEMALFVRYESEGRLHCEVSIYFSPAAVAVAEAVNAIPCNQPSLDGLELLVGSEAMWPAFRGKESVLDRR